MLNLKDKEILVTGGAGFLGGFVVKELIKNGVKDDNIIVPRFKDCDLRIRSNCQKVVEGVDVVIHLAAKVGGIGYNYKNPGSLFYDNAVMAIEMMEAARQAKVKNFYRSAPFAVIPSSPRRLFVRKIFGTVTPKKLMLHTVLLKKCLRCRERLIGPSTVSMPSRFYR